MEERKTKEVEYYNREAKNDSQKALSSNQRFNVLLLESYRFLYEYFWRISKDKKVLDYGCGTGYHLVNLAKTAKEIVGIDLSYNSLQIAKNKIEKEKLTDKAKVLLMDCEELEFEDNSFDIIFDGGTFSSLDLRKALPEMIRVLKPEGLLMGIETLGHNPFLNLKRRVNVLRSKRTEWAANHILKIKDLEVIKNYFSKTEVYFFHLTSWLAFPFLNLSGGKIMIKFFEKIDYFLLFIFPFLKKYSFKTVFIFYGKKII